MKIKKRNSNDKFRNTTQGFNRAGTDSKNLSRNDESKEQDLMRQTTQFFLKNAFSDNKGGNSELYSMTDQSFDKGSDQDERKSNLSGRITGSGSIIKSRRMSREQQKENFSP